MVEFLTLTFQNVSSTVQTGLASIHSRYNKVPRQDIRRQQHTRPPNCSPDQHGQTHSKIGVPYCNGAEYTWWSKHSWESLSLPQQNIFEDAPSWYSPSAFNQVLICIFPISNILHLALILVVMVTAVASTC